MKNLKFSGKFADKDASVDVSVGVFQFMEDNTTIVYSPAFDLSGYGKNPEEAKTSFEIAIEEFFTYTIHKKTLANELKRLGWNVRSMKQRKLTAPVLADQIKENNYLAEILNEKQFTKFDKTVAVPC